MINMKDMLLGATVRASHITRFSTIPVLHKETVAEHSYYVALYTMAIADSFPHMTTEQRDMAIRAALLHDIEECLTGDFLRSFKYSDVKLSIAIKDASGSQATKVIAELAPHRAHEYVELWKHAKAGHLSGRVVRYADFLSVVAYLCKEAALGNQYAIKMMDTELTAYWQNFDNAAWQLFQPMHHQVKSIIEGEWEEVRVTV